MLRLRHGPQREAVRNLLEAGDVLCMKLSLLLLASAPTQGEVFLVDSLTAWLQYPLAPPFGRGQFASMAGHSLDNLRFPQEVVSGHFQGLSPVPLFFF